MLFLNSLVKKPCRSKMIPDELCETEREGRISMQVLQVLQILSLTWFEYTLQFAYMAMP